MEFELKVDFGQVNPMRHEDDVSAPHTVTSRDLKLDNDCATPAHFLSQEEQDENQAGGIAIVKIGPGQRLKLKTAARMGICSKEHAKWCPPVAVATHRFWSAVITTYDELCATLSLWNRSVVSW